MIKALRIPLDKAPLEYTKDILKSMDSKHTCAVLPTARAIRSVSSEPFLNVELFSIKEFTRFANNSSGIHIPKQLKPFYLKKAAMSLSTDDKIAVFRNDKTPLFESMTAFTKSSSGIFSFYRELASEMVEISSLQNVSLYTDYETQIAVLQRLWERYLELIHAAGFTDEWESYRNPSFRDEFISRYDEFVFLIGGYLTKYELEQLRKVGEIKPVTLLFNYSGAKSSHHKVYEKVLDTKLDDRPAPIFNLHNTRLFACTGMLAQAELITSQIFYFNSKHNISFKDMAVVIPDESVKSYFLRLDPYNLYDITSNEDISSRQSFQLLQLAIELTEQYQKSKHSLLTISSIKKILAQPAVKENFDTVKIEEDIAKEIRNGKIYLSVTETIEIEFFNRYIQEILGSPCMLTLLECSKIFIKFLSNISSLCPDEKNDMLPAINQLQMLERIYSKIDDKLPFTECVSIIIQELIQIRVQTPKGKVAVTGILESRNLQFDLVFIPAMNENIFPPDSKKDLFLNTEIRKELNLPTFIDRENLLKNYLLQIMERSRFNIITYTKNSSSGRRSRFIEEIAIHNNITAQDYSPKEITILKSKERFFPKQSELLIEKNDGILEKISKTIYTASCFKDYIECPLRFYFKYIAKVYPEPELVEKLTPASIGSAFHKSMEQLYKDNITAANDDYAAKFTDYFHKELQNIDAYKFSKVEQFRAKEAAQGINKITETERRRLDEGWQTIAREERIATSFDGIPLKGFIDRIDRRGDEHDIIDYKFKDVEAVPSKYDFDKQSDFQMPFYTLLIEMDSGIKAANAYYFDIKSKFNLVSAFDMQYYEPFKEFFISKVDEIKSCGKPFYQTKKIDNCKYCHYQTVCGRVKNENFR